MFMFKIFLFKMLVIVELFVKVKIIEKYFGQGYVVEFLVGYICDLLCSVVDIFEKYKGQVWVWFGFDVEYDFQLLYVVLFEKKQKVVQLCKFVVEVDEIILVIDDDCEGESIVWYLYQEFKFKVLVKWMVFYEIICEVIQVVIVVFWQIDCNLVEVQEVCCVVDWFYGYEVSLVLWCKVVFKFLVGWVQLVVIWMLVECECEWMCFVVVMWWDVVVMVQVFIVQVGEQIFFVWLIEVQGEWLVVGKDFDLLIGQLWFGVGVWLFGEVEVFVIFEGLKGQMFKVFMVEEKFFILCLFVFFIMFIL